MSDSIIPDLNKVETFKNYPFITGSVYLKFGVHYVKLTAVDYNDNKISKDILLSSSYADAFAVMRCFAGYLKLFCVVKDFYQFPLNAGDFWQKKHEIRKPEAELLFQKDFSKRIFPFLTL